MGSKGGKPQTIGYHYKWAMHFAWTDKADALLRVLAGGKAMLVGRITENSSLSINKPNLWGGEKSQGGVVSGFDVLFGAEDQAPSTYLADTFGPKQSGNRGIVSTILRGGRYGAFVPNPKTMEAQFERIHADSLGWYPEKAAISIADGLVLPGDATGWQYQVTSEEADPGNSNLVVPAAGWSSGGQAPFGNGVSGTANTTWPKWTTLWIKRTIKVPPGRSQTLHVTVENGCVVFLDGVDIGAINRANEQLTSNPSFDFPLVGGQTYELAIKAFDEAGHIPTSGTLLTASTVLPGITAMNVAHAIYDAVFHPKMLGQPETLNGNFEEAADIFYNEGFGICAEYNSGEETIWQFIQRLCDAAGCNLNFSRVDGKFYLDVVRGGYDIESLPVITDDDIVEFKAAPFSADEAYNGVRVRWKDQAANMERVTPPVVALGRVRDAGEVRILEKKYIEIPSEYLALRRAQSDCDAVSPALTRYELTVRRKFRGVRVGQPMRLSSLKRGIDTVIRLGSVSQGRLLDGRVRLVAVQDVFNMPALSRVESSAGEFMPASEVPVAAPAQVALEAPYVELVASLPAADLAQVADDAGYLLVAAAPPGNAINYEIASAAGAEEYEERGAADFCPTATVVEAAPLSGVPATGFTLADGYLLDRIAIGSWALWAGIEAGSFELVRVDDIDDGAGTCSLGRGCADTPPIAHAAGARIWFAGDWVGTDGREYVDAETARAKLLPRTPSDQLDISLATEMTVVMSQRWFRPYPPAKLRLNGEAYPAEVEGDLVVTFVARDRLLQADQLVDSEMDGVGPEDGATFNLRVIDRADESVTYSADTVASGDVVPGASIPYLARLEVYSTRDGVESLWPASASFTSGILIDGGMPGGALQESYSFQLSAASATVPVAWTLIAGALPAGVTLDGATGIISGIPTATGYASFTIQAEDDAGRIATRDFILGVGTIKTLLPFDGADGSTTITDKTGRTWTRTGNTHIVASAGALGGAACDFDGSGDYLSAADSADFALGTDDFTIETFFTADAVASGSFPVLLMQRAGFGTRHAFTFSLSDSMRVTFQITSDGSGSGSPAVSSPSGSIALGTRYHAAASRRGGRLYLHLNGAVVSAIDLPSGFSAYNSTDPIRISAIDNPVSNLGNLNGRMDELKFTRGAARYQEQDFTPPTIASDFPTP